MIDIGTLTVVLSSFLPYLLKAGEKAAEEAGKQLGEDTWDWAKGLWRKLHPKIEEKPSLLEAVKDVAANPKDKDYQAVLRVQLKKLLEQDTELANEIASLLQEKPKTARQNIGMVMASRDAMISTGNQTVTQSGIGDNINIGQARDVSLGNPLKPSEN